MSGGILVNFLVDGDGGFSVSARVVRATDMAWQGRVLRSVFRMTQFNLFRTMECLRKCLFLAGIVGVCVHCPKCEAQGQIHRGSSDDSVERRKQQSRGDSNTEFSKPSERFNGFPRPGEGGRRRPNFARNGRNAPSRFFLEADFESRPTSEGFIFVNGKFLSRPYVFRSSGKSTFVNDVIIASEAVRVDSFSGFVDSDDGDGRRSGRSFRETQQTFAEFLDEQFSQARLALVCFDGKAPVLLAELAGGNDLLSVLVSEVHRSRLLTDLLKFSGSPEDVSRWSDWITDFQPSSEFLMAAQPIVDVIDSAYDEGQTRAAAIRRLESFGCPLTIVGMVMSVFAIGHLMSNPPNAGKTRDEVERSPEVIQIVTRSLMLFIALSLLDLVWTLLASQAGTMRELNPVGGRLIDDPAKLILFKAAMTGLAAGLIFKLRYYRRAQLASWWACLILTLLTVRWLTFNSMLA